MALEHSTQKLMQFFKKYKFVVLVLALGVILMAVPSFSNKSDEDIKYTDISPQPTETAEEKLENILRQINGAGDVRVMLTTVSGEETIYQTDTKNDTRNDSVETNIETVIITDQGRGESGLIRQVNPPKYLGAIVVCQGGDDPKVQLAITDAVSKITGLGANHISVLKMK